MKNARLIKKGERTTTRTHEETNSEPRQPKPIIKQNVKDPQQAKNIWDNLLFKKN